MARGGKRLGAGRPSKWKTSTSDTKVIRLPIQLANAIRKARNEGLSVNILTKAIEKAIEKAIQNKKNSSESLTKSKKSQDRVRKIESVTQSIHIELWHDETQCQAMTASGKRCQHKYTKGGKSSFVTVTYRDYSGKVVEYLSCHQHEANFKPYDIPGTAE